MSEAALPVATGHAGRRPIVPAFRPSAWMTVTACAGRGPASPAAPRPGTLHPDADRPVACWTGCLLAATRVKTSHAALVSSGCGGSVGGAV
jgi:hypothetical protein